MLKNVINIHLHMYVVIKIDSLLNAGRVCFLMLLVAMMFKFWVPWACWLHCYKRKVISLNLLTVLGYCFYKCFCIKFLISAELDESMLDALGILPQRKQHKKLLLVCRIDNYFCIFAWSWLLICPVFWFSFWELVARCVTILTCLLSWMYASWNLSSFFFLLCWLA